MIRKEIVADFAPGRLGPTVGAGVVAGILTVSYGVSLAALVFRGQLAGSLSEGVGMMLWSTFVVGLVATFRSSLPGTVPSAGGKAAAVLAASAAAVADQVDPDALFPTVLALATVATAATAVGCLVLGWFRLGSLVRYVPYPVVGGFMASAGLLTAQGGWDILSNGNGLRDLWVGPAPGLWVPGLVIAITLFAAFRSSLHRMFLPLLLVGSGLGLHLGFLTSGISREEVTARGWILVSGVDGSVWRPDRIGEIADADGGALVGGLGAVSTIVVLVLASLLFYGHALELATDTDVDLHRELRSTGWGAVLAGAGGGVPAYTNLDASLLNVEIGGPRRSSALLAALIAGVALLIGGDLLSLFPTALVGGMLIATGCSTIVEWVWGRRRSVAGFELVSVVAIVAAVALFGFVAGTMFGVVVAVFMFLVRYSRISVIRHELTAAALSSNVDRTPAEQRLLAERADEVVLIELRGYLFFGTASGVVDAVRRRLDPDQSTSVIVFDFERVIGIDSSTVVAFEKIGRLAAHHGVTLALAGADQHIADSLLPHLGDRHDLTVVQFDDADRALQHGEELILGSHGDRDRREPTVVPVRDLLGAVLDDQAAVAAIATHLCCVELAAGERLIEQDRPGQGLFFLERGRLTAFLERPPRAPLRLRTMLPGAVVGEISQYSKGAASATVCADQPSVVWRLGGDEFDGLARTDPKAAAALHLFVARVLTERVTHAEKTVRDLRR